LKNNCKKFREIEVNKRLMMVMERGKYNLFARLAWHKDIEKDFIREFQMDEIRLRGK